MNALIVDQNSDSMNALRPELGFNERAYVDQNSAGGTEVVRVGLTDE